MSLEHVVAHLRCPQCAADIRIDGAMLACAAGHRYDIARQGYVNLLGGGAHAGTADTSAMVAARQAFLARGHFDPLVDAVAAEAQRLVLGAVSGCVIDLGAGPGQFLATVLERLPTSVGLALDLSKYAVRRAARAHPRIGAAVCDTWRPLPVQDAAAALVLDIFAPRNGHEIARVLRPGGALLVVTPTPDHLRELIGPLGLLSIDDDKPARVRGQLAPHLTYEDETPLRFPMEVDHVDAETIAAMGPSAWHLADAELARRVHALPPAMRVTAAVTLSVYRRPVAVATSTVSTR